MTDQEKQETKAELKALLEQLTTGDAAGTAISAQLDEVEKDTDALENKLAEAKIDIDVIVEESGKQIDAVIAAEQAEA
jgi:hypothetical protein